MKIYNRKMPYVKGLINGVQVEDTRVVVIMVGLPARGKSLIAQKSEFGFFPELDC